MTRFNAETWVTRRVPRPPLARPIRKTKMLESLLLTLFRSLPAARQESFRRKISSGRDQPRRTFSAPLDDFIAFAFDADLNLDADERLRVRNILGKEDVESLGDARAVLMALDQQRFPTPMLIRFQADDVNFAQVNGISCAVDRRDMATSAYGAHWTTYEPHLVACLKRICRPGSAVFDIGANIGYHSLLLSQLVGSEGRVYAFEPNSENCRLILLGAAHNDINNIVLLPVALSDARGWSYFTTHIGSNGGLLRQDAALLRQHGTIVPTLTLDEMSLPPVETIKIDVEGAEYKALKGGERLLARDRPAIVCEFSVQMVEHISDVRAADFLGWIASMDYGISILDRTSCEAVSIESPEALLGAWGRDDRIEDLLMLPREKSGLIAPA
jgi:FkbM family methyltransferase